MFFQVENGINEFSYSGEDLQSLSAYHRIICFCNILPVEVTMGTISGVKLADGNWDISIDVELTGLDETINNIAVDEEFTENELTVRLF